jgi:hypothetical protein
MNTLTNEHIQEEIDNKISKLLNYYMSLQQLVSIYLEQLLKFIEDKNKKELLETKLHLFQNLHIKKIPEWFQFFYKDYNLNELSVTVTNTSGLMNKYASRLKDVVL